MKISVILIVISLLACIFHSSTASKVYEPLEQSSIIKYDWAKNYNFGQRFRPGFDRLSARLLSTFERAYNRTYRPEEIAHRSKLLSDNLQMIRDWNALYAQGKVSYSMKLNDLADRTDQELEQLDGLIVSEDDELKSVSKKRLMWTPKGYDNLPSQVDYSKHPCNTPVRHQGPCGSCYAFAAADLVGITRCIQSGNETFYRRARSTQYIVDCGLDHRGMYGCDGGSLGHVLIFLRKTGGLTTESSYPYKYREGTCKNYHLAYTLPYPGDENPKYQLLESEEEFKDYLANYGPIAASMDTSRKFVLYDHGIFDDASCGDDDDDSRHAVLVVGYGRESGKDYWLIKNSWGKDWGENGYMKIARGKYTCNLGYRGWGLPYDKSMNY